MSLPVAIQLFSVRDDMASSPVETLRALKKMGYQGVEPAGLCGLTPEYFKGVCDALGLEIVSAHVPYSVLDDEPEKTVDIYRYLGCKYVAIPFLGEDLLPGGKEFENTPAQLRKIGESLKAAGIQLLYHNHSHEFKKVNGDFCLDTLYSTVSSELLKAELDTGWINYSKIDPAEYILRFKGRLPVVHLKDYDSYDRTKKDNSAFITCPFARGVLDAEGVLKASVEAGAEWLVVEQDRPYKNKSALRCAEISRKNLKALGF